VYTLEPAKFAEYNLSNLRKFVNFWSAYYKYSVKKIGSEEEIDYFHEINIDNDLTKSNVVNLLRWKDPKYLTNTIFSGPNEGASNHRVDRVLSKLSVINSFRRSEVNPEEFKKITSQFFPNGVIWEIFVFHISKPLEYPIADQHVFRSYSYHKNCNYPVSWKKYDGYRKYFSEMIEMLYASESDLNRLENQKQLDDALMVYGKFLKQYEVES